MKPFEDWSPNGQLIAFICDYSGSSEVCVMDANGNNIRLLTSGNNTSSSPAWSPNGNGLAYATREEIKYEMSITDVWFGNTQSLTDGQHKALNPAWSPDGNQIVYASDQDGDYRIAAGEDLRCIYNCIRANTVSKPEPPYPFGLSEQAAGGIGMTNLTVAIVLWSFWLTEYTAQQQPFLIRAFSSLSFTMGILLILVTLWAVFW